MSASVSRPRKLVVGSTNVRSASTAFGTVNKSASRLLAEVGAAVREEDLMREVLNTVGKPGRLGGSIRCVGCG